MATITMTEILGSDNLAGSRITINNNFKTAQNAINTLEQRLNTSFVPGGSLNVGDALIKKYTRPLTQIIFVVEASGQIQGDFYVVGATNTTGAISVGTNLNVAGNVVFSNSAAPTPGGYTLDNALRTYATNGYAHEQFWAGNSYSLPVDINALPTVPSATLRELDPTLFDRRRVIHLDLSTTDFTLPTSCTTLRLPLITSPSVENGQIVTFVIDLPALAAGVTDVLFIDNTNLDPIYTSPIPLNDDGTTVIDLSTVDIQKVFITFYASQTGWKVLSAHHYVDISTY
jgi:hypothetical protein